MDKKILFVLPLMLGFAAGAFANASDRDKPFLLDYAQDSQTADAIHGKGHAYGRFKHQGDSEQGDEDDGNQPHQPAHPDFSPATGPVSPGTGQTTGTTVGPILNGPLALPESGSTAALLGMSLVGLCAAGRFARR